MQQALAIWQQSDQMDALDGIEKDPVFSLLMMALAYQANEFDSELERLKSEVLDDFARLLVPYDMAHATPATAVVEAVLQDEVAEMSLDENTRFLLAGEHPFLPLMETRALNAEVRSVVRMDGRRWKVTLGFKYPVSDLSGFAFVIKNTNFRSVKLYIKGQRLPVIKPWHYSELPFCPAFSPDSMTYNLGQICNLSLLPLDLFARQHVRFFCIEKHDPKMFLPSETDQIDLVFEFTGVRDDFRFDKNCLILNPVMLVNAQIREVSLSSANPVARLTGARTNDSDKYLTTRQFLHLIRPLETQIYGNTALEVRGVAGDRFNSGSLLKLINCIVTRYHSDFYAYQQMKGTLTDDALQQLESALTQMRGETVQNALESVSGVYLMPRGGVQSQKKEFSLNVRYVTTAGAAINSMLTPSSAFTAPSGFKPGACQMIAAPVPGMDELQDVGNASSLLRFYMATGDRIVTMADIKAFCRKELLVRYGIGDEMIRSLSVRRRRQLDPTGNGYEILVDIVLTGNSFIRRSFTDKISSAEILIQKMMEVRSANIYPIRLSISIEDSNN